MMLEHFIWAMRNDDEWLGDAKYECPYEKDWQEKKAEKDLEDELDRYAEECSEVRIYNRGYCDIPNYGDWRDKGGQLAWWAKNIKARDGHKCRKPGCESKENLHAHHIHNKADNPDIMYEAWNGITLCQYHHVEFHRRYGKSENTEEQLSEFFRST